MRIAIDITSIPVKKAGVGLYVLKLIDQLQTIDQTNQYLIFIRRRDINNINIRNPNFKLYSVRHFSRVHGIVWEQLVLPFILLRKKVKVLHSPHYTCPFLKLGWKQVITFHDMTYFLFPKRHRFWHVLFFRFIMKRSIHIADAIMADSESTKNDILKYFKLDPEKITTVHLGVSNDYMPQADGRAKESIVQKYQLPSPDYILFVGTLEPRKNIQGLIKAFALIAKAFPKLVLVVAGQKGWHYEEIFKLVRENNLNDKIIFTGYVAESELPKLFAGAKLFIYPSFYEGFGLPVLEAMACGIPVITSNISSMAEIASGAARLINPDRIEEIANEIQLVLSNDQLSKQLAEKGLARTKMFSWKKMAEQNLLVYSS